MHGRSLAVNLRRSVRPGGGDGRPPANRPESDFRRCAV